MSEPLFEQDNKTALQAIFQAQSIAFAPFVFQASVLLRDRGILAFIESRRAAGASTGEVEEAVALSHYAVRVLLEAGLGIDLLYRKFGNYFLSKTGHIFLNDKMTRINTDFMRDVCYEGAKDLAASLEEGRPKGLRHLGPWETIYQGLSILPEPAKRSWFEFDHFYSDRTFSEALPFVFATQPRSILDIGGNTGKWAAACLAYDRGVAVGIVDLAVQLNVAKENLQEATDAGRMQFYDLDVLAEATEIPFGYNVFWMSQFLDCFADHQILSILKKCFKALPDDGRIFINETFWDRQRYAASGFSLQMTSIYFTTMANGNSQMYDSAVFIELIKQSGFTIEQIHDNIGMSHTLIELRK